MGGKVTGKVKRLSNHGHMQIDQALASIDHLDNSGVFNFAGQLQAGTINNRSSILSSNGTFQVSQQFTNDGLAQAKAVTGKGVLINHGELHLQDHLGIKDFINKRQLRGKNLSVSSDTFTNEANIHMLGKLDLGQATVKHIGHLKSKQLYINKSFTNEGDVEVEELHQDGDRLKNTAGSSITVNGKTNIKATAVTNYGELRLNGNTNLSGDDFSNYGELYIKQGKLYYTNDFVNYGYYYRSDIQHCFNYLLNLGVIETAFKYNVLQTASYIKCLRGNKLRHRRHTFENRGLIKGAYMATNNAANTVINNGEISVESTDLHQSKLLNHNLFKSRKRFEFTGSSINNTGDMELRGNSNVNATLWVNRGKAELHGQNNLNTAINNSGTLLLYGKSSISGDLYNNGYCDINGENNISSDIINRKNLKLRGQNNITGNKLDNCSDVIDYGRLELSGHNQLDVNVSNRGTIILSGNNNFSKVLELGKPKNYRSVRLVLHGDGVTRVKHLKWSYWYSELEALGKTFKAKFKLVIDKLVRRLKLKQQPAIKGQHQLQIDKLSGQTRRKLKVRGAVQLRHYFYDFSKVQAVHVECGSSNKRLKKFSLTKYKSLGRPTSSDSELHIYVDMFKLPSGMQLERLGTFAIYGKVENHGRLEAKKLIIKHPKKGLFNTGVLRGDEVDIDVAYVDNRYGNIKGTNSVKVVGRNGMDMGQRKEVRSHWFESNGAGVKSGGWIELHVHHGEMELDWALLMAAGPIYVKCDDTTTISAKMIGLISDAYCQILGHNMVVEREEQRPQSYQYGTYVHHGRRYCSKCRDRISKVPVCTYTVYYDQSDPALIRVTGKRPDLAPDGKAGVIDLLLNQFTLKDSYLETSGKIRRKKGIKYNATPLAQDSVINKNYTTHTSTGVVRSGSYEVEGIDHVFYDGRSAKMPQRRLLPGSYRIADLAAKSQREGRIKPSHQGQALHKYAVGDDHARSKVAVVSGDMAAHIKSLPGGQQLLQKLLMDLPSSFSQRSVNDILCDHLRSRQVSDSLTGRLLLNMQTNAQSLGEVYLTKAQLQAHKRTMVVSQIKRMHVSKSQRLHFYNPTQAKLAKLFGLKSDQLFCLDEYLEVHSDCDMLDNSLVASGSIKADRDIVHDEIGTLAMARATMDAGGDISTYAIRGEIYPDYTQYRWSNGRTTCTRVITHPSKVHAKGKITKVFKEGLVDTASEWVAEGGDLTILSQYGDVIGKAAFNTSSSSSHHKKRSHSSSSHTAVTSKYRTTGSLNIGSLNGGKTQLHGSELHANGIKFHGDVHLFAVYDKRSMRLSSTKKGLFKTKLRSSGSNNATTRECVLDSGTGQVEFDVDSLVRAEVRASGSALQKVLADSEFDNIVYSLMSDHHKSYDRKRSRLNANAVTLLSLATAMAIPAVGSGLVGTIATAGLKAAASQLLVKTVETKGNILEGMKWLREKGAIKQVFRAMAVAGLTSSILGNAAASPDTLSERFLESAVKSTINMALDIGLDGTKPGRALKDAARLTVASTISGVLANRIGHAYYAGKLPDVLHESLQGIAAAAGVKLQGGNNQAAKAAFVGGVAGEVFGKWYRSQHTEVFDDPDPGYAVRQELLKQGVDAAKLVAAGVATLFELDAAAASNAADTVVRENALAPLLAFAVAYLTVEQLADIYALYQAGDIEEALTRLTQYGIVCVTLSHIGAATYQLGKASFKSAQAAWYALEGPITSRLVRYTHKAIKWLKEPVIGKGLGVRKPNMDPKNVAIHNEYKVKLRRNMQKPYVENADLKELVNWLYRPNAKVGSGSTAEALRFERATGKKVGGKTHNKKVPDAIRNLEKWIKNNPKSCSGDRAAADNILADLRNSLNS